MIAGDDRRSVLFRTRVDDSDSISTAIVFAVCELVGLDPEVAPPLQESVDPAALDRLLEEMHQFAVDTDFAVDFTYLGHPVRVQGDGLISIY